MTYPKFEPYRRFHFMAFIPETGEAVGLAECYQDPFAGTVVLVRAYSTGDKTLSERLTSTKLVTIYLLGKTTARPLDVAFEAFETQFPPLNAMESGVALDIVELRAPKITTRDEVPLAELPFAIRRTEYVTQVSS